MQLDHPDSKDYVKAGGISALSYRIQSIASVVWTLLEELRGVSYTDSTKNSQPSSGLSRASKSLFQHVLDHPQVVRGESPFG